MAGHRNPNKKVDFFLLEWRPHGQFLYSPGSPSPCCCASAFLLDLLILPRQIPSLILLRYNCYRIRRWRKLSGCTQPRELAASAGNSTDVRRWLQCSLVELVIEEYFANHGRRVLLDDGSAILSRSCTSEGFIFIISCLLILVFFLFSAGTFYVPE